MLSNPVRTRHFVTGADFILDEKKALTALGHAMQRGEKVNNRNVL
jgi:hypothetical protein